MGTWGTALYSDDLAADIRSDFRDLVGEGLAPDDVLARLLSEYSSSLADPDEAAVVWLAIADSAWRLGRPIARATTQALQVIENGADLRRWEVAKHRRARSLVLEKLAANLRSQPPPAKRIAKRRVADNTWNVGEVVAFRLTSGAWTLFRVIGHHEDQGGRHSVCEPLDWIGREPPVGEELPQLSLRASVRPWDCSQFLLGEPHRKQDKARFSMTTIRSTPAQQPHRYMVFVFPQFDRQLRDVFGLE